MLLYLIKFIEIKIKVRLNINKTIFTNIFNNGKAF